MNNRENNRLTMLHSQWFLKILGPWELIQDVFDYSLRHTLSRLFTEKKKKKKEKWDKHISTT